MLPDVSNPAIRAAEERARLKAAALAKARRALLAAVADGPVSPGVTKQIAEVEGLSFSVVQQALWTLEDDGSVVIDSLFRVALP